jgi:hypothetical protein
MKVDELLISAKELPWQKRFPLPITVSMSDLAMIRLLTLAEDDEAHISASEVTKRELTR